ncbi:MULTISPECIES: hypothetical protein [unclassified Acinetobacter]|uniref:hypothetical protein n=1 Tax=unclassified Acinetobacter TaxID=196816 RepID=UPI00190E5826|nr:MULTISPECIES: hypothetical protein [unclassified Acinetobacter]MBK0062154.1 hypothetical protein [Acinetobacter sp. S55]MBK0065958.1 hypothetical protein [Acinetobacter sp. S54]
MPNLDVSDVLLDPDFMTKDLKCKRVSVVVGGNGRPNKTEQEFQFSGVVTTNSGQNMDRREDGTLIKGAINIHTKTQLTAGDNDHQADEITWKGKIYYVVQVLDNLHYGHGFNKAICDLKPLG